MVFREWYYKFPNFKILLELGLTGPDGGGGTIFIVDIVVTFLTFNQMANEGQRGGGVNRVLIGG